MPLLSALTRVEVERHNTDKSCYVTLGQNVYDVTEFLEGHPGGSGLILDYAGQDINAIFKDAASHIHSDSAFDILEEFLVGFVVNDEMTPKDKVQTGGNGKQINKEWTPFMRRRTSISWIDDSSKETDCDLDYRKHKFIDLSKPMLKQVWSSGFSKRFYLDQVHRARHYKGGKSAPLFGNFLEPLSLTPWWVIPSLWLPFMAYGTYISREEISGGWIHVMTLWMFGLFLWTLLEYILHRFLFHLDNYLPDNRVALTLHFLLHGIHHYLPMDKNRLVMPPALFIVLATPFWKLAHVIFYWNWHMGTAAFCGGIFGYICYDMTHYFVHHNNLPLWFKQLKQYHLAHHFLDYELGFGVTSRFWDRIFGTELVIMDKAS